ncbi:MAG: hypothetical protein E2O88_04565 [Bacteroidetes bacterium]|nr:MAG: hypothetical protein E2O88_04565 [Bacteroidota bacterium]
MEERILHNKLIGILCPFSSVGLLGSRQVGKTTRALGMERFTLKHKVMAISLPDIMRELQ